MNIFSHETGNLAETVTPFRGDVYSLRLISGVLTYFPVARARMVLFYVSASFFILGLLIVCGGMLCKMGRFHRHFRNNSYEILEGRGSAHESYSRQYPL